MTKKTGRLRKGFAPVAALLLLLALLAAIPALQAVRNPAQPDAPHVGGTGASEDATEAQSESKLPEVCKQLSEEALALDTEQLIEEILKATDIFMHAGLDSSGTNWYPSLREHFNGIRELESRPDAGNRLLELCLVEYGKAEPEMRRLVSMLDLLDIPVFRDMLTADERAMMERDWLKPFVVAGTR